jgi:protein required for attachment to host cells
MEKAWILVADSARARIFAAAKPMAPLEEVEDMAHPEARRHEQELTTDVPGRAFDSAGSGRHAMGGDEPAKRHEIETFARQVAERLSRAASGNEFQHLLLVAPPAFLGVLRDAVDDGTRERVRFELDKNLVWHDAAQIRAHLPDRLWSLQG